MWFAPEELPPASGGRSEVRGQGEGLVGPAQGRARMARANWHHSTCRPGCRDNGDVPRGLSSLSRSEDHEAASRTAQEHPRAQAGGVAGEHLVLWERGHLQYHTAGDVRGIAEAEAE